jgi:MFS family permease
MKDYFRSMSFESGRRDVWIVAACTGISYAGDFLAETALVLTVQQRGGSGMVVAALLLAAMVPLVAMGPVAGRIVDRYSSRVLLVGVGAVQVVVCAGLAFARASWLVIALVAVLAAGLAVTGPTLGALVPQMVDRDRLPRAQATVQTVRGVGILAGPALAGVLVGTYGQAVPLLADAASYLAVVAAGLLLATVRRGGAIPVDPGTGKVRGGFSLVRADRLLVGALVLITAGITSLTCDNVGEVFLIRGTLHGTATAYGLLGALWSVAALGGTWLLGRRTPGDRGLVAVLAIVLAALGLVMLGMAGAPSVPWLIPVYVVGGLGNGALNLALGVLLGRRVAPEARGRVGAVCTAVANAGTVAGYAGGGLLLSVLTPRTLFVVGGLVCVLVVATLAVPVLRVSALAVAPAPAVSR